MRSVDGRSDIEQAVREVLAEVLRRPTDDIPLDAQLYETLGMDSMTTIETSIALESRLGVAMPDFATPDEVGLRTVADMVALAERLVAAQPAQGSN